MTDLRYERMKIIGVMAGVRDCIADARDRIGYYRDALEKENTEEDKASLVWARDAHIILANLTNNLILQ